VGEINREMEEEWSAKVLWHVELLCEKWKWGKVSGKGANSVIWKTYL